LIELIDFIDPNLGLGEFLIMWYRNRLSYISNTRTGASLMGAHGTASDTFTAPVNLTKHIILVISLNSRPP
jgi:hypothetical protein